jgi:periplasmic divalent cation tolerance protein
MKSKVSFAYCTFPDLASAEKICEMLVREKLIACANILGESRSIYLWDGKLQKEREVAAILKLASSKRKTLSERIRGAHPYSNPCVVFWTIDGGLPDFLIWICTASL